MKFSKQAENVITNVLFEGVITESKCPTSKRQYPHVQRHMTKIH